MNGISPTGATQALTPMDTPSGLSPDALISYCASRLRSIDSQINTIFTNQQQMRIASNAIGHLQEKINFALSLEKPSDKCQLDEEDGPLKEEIRVAFEQAVAALPDGHPQKAVLKARYDHYLVTLDDAKVSRGELNMTNEVISNVAKDIGSSSELDMISLQSAMSQRQTAIQLCTNLIASLSEASKLIAQRIG